VSQSETKKEGSVMRKRKLTRQIGALFPEKTYHQLVQLANQMELSVAEVVRNMVERCLSQMEDEEDRDERKN